MHELDKPECFDKMLPGKAAQVMRWISDHMEPSRQYGKNTSYGLKHILEDDLNLYVTNGEFKGAMLKAGYKPKDANELNWIFKARSR